MMRVSNHPPGNISKCGCARLHEIPGHAACLANMIREGRQWRLLSFGIGFIRPFHDPHNGLARFMQLDRMHP